MEEKLFSLKPEFILSKNIGINFIMAFPVGVLAGITCLSWSTMAIIIISGVTCFLWLFIAFINEKFNYEATEYVVYASRIEFKEGFINLQDTTLMIKDIKEIYLRRSFIQNFYNLGTIRFVTAANAPAAKESNIYKTGINFRDIKDSVLIYNEIKKLMDEQNNKN